MPSGFAVTHYLFTYQSGFMKRALWGELLWRLFGGWTARYFFLAGVALVVLAVFVGIAVRACRRMPAAADTTGFLLVFAASPALAFFAHIVGYLEQIAYVALLIGVACRTRRRIQVAWFLGAA